MSLQEENEALKRRIKELEERNQILQHAQEQNLIWPFPSADRLSNAEIRRFGRQLILPDIGISGQLKLRNASMLVVGAGGLGSPICLYLAGAGVGRIGIIDHDEVDVSNLHRQVIHDESRVGVNKAQSAATSINRINSTCQVIPYDCVIDSSNAMDIIPKYDIVLDATDNVATRYLLNDACVIAGKPLVSGSALRMDGQLTAYNYNGGPCYRCLHPNPPPPETVTNCSDGGVLGVIPGIIGCIQALQAIKISIGLAAQDPPSLLIFSGAQPTMFRTMKLRPRKEDCVVCGKNPTITELIDYVQFCGRAATDKDAPLQVLDADDRIMVEGYHKYIIEDRPHLLLDVREQVQYDICHLPNSLHIPLRQLGRRVGEVKQAIEGRNQDVYVICRLGNDSQLAVKILEEHGIPSKDIVGGLHEWSHRIDTDFPIY
ncbi:adenylyltransferase [Umbelopsis sp. PMI_123]|nr:adenylyltransferase [Umbelopsis sp. PMI_123]